MRQINQESGVPASSVPVANGVAESQGVARVVYDEPGVRVVCDGRIVDVLEAVQAVAEQAAQLLQRLDVELVLMWLFGLRAQSGQVELRDLCVALFFVIILSIGTDKAELNVCP